MIVLNYFLTTINVLINYQNIFLLLFKLMFYL